MYLVVARALGKPEARSELAQVLTEVAAASRAEDGCLSYEFTADLENPNSFASIETWIDKAALQAHLAAPGTAEALEKLGPLLAGSASITGYDVPAEPEPLM